MTLSKVRQSNAEQCEVNMTHTPDYDPPWGRPQSTGEMAAIHPRWSKDMRAKFGRMTPPTAVEGEDWSLAQCGGCCYFIPLEGSIGMDWGVCSNARSEHDRTATFEHFGCFQHSEADRIVEKD